MNLISPVSNDNLASTSPLDFVWFELTNRCNLRCVHCYAESGPTGGAIDVLNEQNYLDLISQVHALGCRKIQFIGGEPTLNKSLPKLIQTAFLMRFDFIEVFTNLTRVPEELLNTFCRFNVAVATSFYSWNPHTHDAITGKIGSFDATIRNMRRILDAGLTLRAGIIRMEQNSSEFAETWNFLEEMGVKQIGSDRVRQIGRAGTSTACDMGELCGSCAGNILSIGPDGLVAPCNMSKNWAVGSVLESRLEDIVASPRLKNLRLEIKQRVGEREAEQPHAVCNPKTCGPYSTCCPTTQSCAPCAPNGCIPCFPKG